MSHNPNLHKCERCGLSTPARYCQSCRIVDPVFCADHLDQHEMREIRKRGRELARAERLMLMKAIGRNVENASFH